MEENNQTDQNQNINSTPPVSQDTQTPSSTPPVSNVAKPKPKFPLVLIIGIFLFVLIAGSAAGFYILKQQSLKTAVKPTPLPVVQKQIPTPTPDPTANWKTYINTKVGFEIKYPSLDMLPSYPVGNFGGQPKTVDGTEDSKVIEFPGQDKNYANAFLLELFPYSGTLEKLPELEAKNRLYYAGDKPEKMQKILTVDGLPAIWFRRVDEKRPDNYMYEIYSVSKNHAFIFHGATEEQMEQILSTFKFTDNNDDLFLPDHSAMIYETSHSPDGSYIVLLAGFNSIVIENSNKKVLFEDAMGTSNWQLISQKMQEADGLKNQGQTGVGLGVWKNSTTLGLKILNAVGNEFEIDVNASTGKIIESSFKMTK